jgi:glutamine synthetase
MDTLRDAIADIENLQFVDALCVDTNGKLRGKRLTRSDVEKLSKGSLNIPQALFSLAVNGVALDGGGRGISDGDPDGYCYPVVNTFSPIPWADVSGGQVLIGMKDAEGAPIDIDPRHMLENLVDALGELGFRTTVAFELEFYLLESAAVAVNFVPTPVSARNAAGGYYGQNYGIDALDKYHTVLKTITDYASAMSVPTRAISSESGIGQFEVNLCHVSSPVLAADHAVLLRQLIKKAAQKHGYEATFMAKPFADQPGSGMHVHIAITDYEGNNLFDSARDGTALLTQCIAGLHALMPPCMPFFAPNINAFRRFVPGSFVPVNRSWGYDNRSVAMRIPLGDPRNTRIEHRVSGADANPILVISAILAGIIHGIANKMRAEPAVTGNYNERTDSAFPADFGAALGMLETNAEIRLYFGQFYPAFFADLKRKEVAEFQKEYSEAEYQWYL